MRKLLKSFLIPADSNNFLPRIIGFRALVLYCFLSVLIFFFISPIFVQVDRFLAHLTQDLIIKEVNPVREEQGFLTLKANEKLNEAAQMKAEDMLEKDYFDHISPDGKYPWEWLKEVDYNYAAAAENLAINASEPKSLVRAWLNSPSHAKNILNGYFTDIGIGIAKGEMQGRDTTVVVMFLGREVPQDIRVGAATTDNLDNNIKRPESLASTISIEDTLPEEPVLIQTVEEDVLYKENVIKTADVSQEQILPNGTNEKIFLVSELPLQARFALTIFFNILILWILATFLISREKFLVRAFNSLVITGLVFFIWLPEIL